MDLNDYRNTLDDIDTQLLALFQARMDTVRQIAAYKKRHRLPVLSAGREQEILDRVRTASGDTLAPYAVSLFETLLSVSRDYQEALCRDV